MMKRATVMIALCSFMSSAIAQANCSGGDPYITFTCPSGHFDYCSDSSLSSNIIIRCIDGCPEPGNCNDDLAAAPPYGVKTNAVCYQDSATAGNAQCTYDCVNVTKADGTVFFPVGCSFQLDNSTGPPVSTSLPIPSATSSSVAPPSTSSTQTLTLSNPTPASSGGAMALQTGAATALALGLIALFL